MIIDLLRHGEPVGGQRYRGHGCDDPLSSRGWAQMWSAVGIENSSSATVVEGAQRPHAEVSGGGDPMTQWSMVITSPMRRCREFSEAFCRAAGLVSPVVIDDLREVGFGVWEGHTREAIERDRGDEYYRFCADPEHARPPGAEPLAEFRRRVAAALTQIEAMWVARAEGSNEGPILVVAHAGTIRALLGQVLDLPHAALYRIDCRYASLSRITCTRDRGWRVGFVNRVS
ncbi:MAG: histidine phosphatase family protein [Thioalkalivibrionaceae bacterium]